MLSMSRRGAPGSGFKLLLGELAGEVARYCAGHWMTCSPQLIGRRRARPWHAPASPLPIDSSHPWRLSPGRLPMRYLRACAPLPPLRRALINNGGDITFYLGEGETVTIGLAARPEDLAIAGTITLNTHPMQRAASRPPDGAGAAKVSALPMRSLSSPPPVPASADAAATMIANAVTIDHPAITRIAAHHAVKDDSDLGDLPGHGRGRAIAGRRNRAGTEGRRGAKPCSCCRPG